MTDDILATEHMRAQVANSAAVQTLAGELWRRGIDRANFAGSFDRIRPALVTLIVQGRRRAASIADGYYTELMREVGFTPATIADFADDIDAELLTAAVDGTARRNVTVRALNDTAVAASLTARDEVLTSALSGVLGMVKARVGAGGTDRLFGIADADARVKGWARITDGSPCSRCALAVSHGPVYRSRTSASFMRHDGCGCSAKLLVGDGDGWTEEARHYREQWDATRDEGDFRTLLTHKTARFDPLATVDVKRFAPTA